MTGRSPIVFARYRRKSFNDEPGSSPDAGDDPLSLG
jgi:hypothetical protein